MAAQLYSLLHPLWRRLPADFRRRLFFELHALALPRRPAAGRPGEPPLPFYMAGLFRSATGLGEAARLLSRGLHEAGMAHQAVDLSGTALGGIDDLPPWPGCDRLPAGPGSLLIHAQGPMLSYALRAAGGKRLRGKRLIAYWHWELPRLSPLWRRAADLVDEVWVPSRFVAEAVAGGIDKPVRLLPYPLQRPGDGVLAAGPGPASFDASRPFMVASMFNMSSGFARKNPLAAVNAFRAAFGRSRDARLRIKVQNAQAYPAGMAALQAAIAAAAPPGAADNIELITAPMTRQQVWQFLAEADIVLSLHRAEGLGLLAAEAMALGRPVVATDYSATAEFIDATNGMPIPYRLVPASDPQGLYPTAGQSWAEPDIAAAAAALRQLRDDAGLRRWLGDNARAAFSRHFGQAAFAARLAALLAQP